ncbi:MAG: response regulator [Deltaproteobacteria bacterium]|nr:response regulator [Deltaproteobacteria bacterium]
MLKILVVDDESSIRKLMLLLLADDYDVVAVDAADVALEKLETEHWDLVITDYKMPRKTGIDLVVNLRSQGSRIPVIIMTGQGSQDSQIKSVKDTVATVLSKPFSRESLVAAIETLFPARLS